MASSLRSRVYALLRASEKYVKTDMVYLAHGSFWLGTAQLFSVFTTLVLALAFANLLPQNVYGEYRYILSVAGILTMFTLTGMNTALAQSVARGFEGSFRMVFRTRTRWGLIAGIGSIAVAIYYFHAGNTDLVVPFILGGIFLPFFDPLTVYSAYLQGKKRFKELSLYGNLEQVVSTVAFVSVLFFTDNLVLIVLTYFLSWTAVRLFLYWLVQKQFPPNSTVDTGTSSYGTHLSVLGFMNGLVSYLDKLLVFHYVGAVDLAIYSIALAPVDQIKSLFKNIPNLTLPVFSKKSIAEIDSMLYWRLVQLITLGAAFAAIYMVVAPYAFPILFPKYLASIRYSEWYAIGLIFTPAVIFLGSIYQAKPSLIAFTYTGTIAANLFLIIGMIVLGYYFGVMGIVAARVIQYFLNLIFGIFLWQKTKRAQLD